MIEKAPRDLPLYARHVLTILDSVMRSQDINMIEESITTFETFCRYIDYASLAADQHLSHQYLSLAQSYAHFASKEYLQNPKIAKTTPLVFRWRTVSLKAIRSMVSSEAILTDPAKQLEIVIPVVLDNLYLEDDDILAALQQKAQTNEKIDFEAARKRRMSVATVNTIDTSEADPATAAGTTDDADKLARDEVRVLAVRCLKQIFAAGTASNRGQIRLATTLTLKFIASRSPALPSHTSVRPSLPGGKEGNWATSLIEAIARWTPVQDRFIIVLTAMETLVRSPIVESVLRSQLVLATMIDWLLSSSVNLIGLSVMDILLGLLNHMLLLLQLGTRESPKLFHRSTALDLFKDTKDTFTPTEPFVQAGGAQEEDIAENDPSPTRQELLLRLQKCIGNLATHIYYTDQITDMMTAILTRLKPSTPLDASVSSLSTEDPTAMARSIAAVVKAHEDPSTDGFFSFATARVIALHAIKEILLISNARRMSSGANTEARSRVGMQVWEGTQWLLRDEDREVRAAYVDALLTWLKLETNQNDQHLPKEGPRKQKALRKQDQNGDSSNLTKRAVSNASKREVRPAKSNFLQLLHLAVFDNVLESPENDADILLAYVLLANLVERLGVNALRTGLPMMLELQNEALHEDDVPTAVSKVHMASLVLGYLWTICEKFDFESTRVGNEVNAEISRRKRFQIWLGKIRFPPLSVEQIPAAVLDESKAEIPADSVGAIKPFLSVNELVDEIALSYDNSLVSSAASPPSSPGRVFSVPTLGFGYGYGMAPAPRPSPEDQLPQKVKDELLGSWSKEGCLAAVERSSLKTASVTGSRAGASTRARHLYANGLAANGGVSGRESPTVAHPLETHGVGGAVGVVGVNALDRLRRLSTNDGSPGPITATSSRESMMRITDLKQALLGNQTKARRTSPLRRPMSKRSESFRSDGSDSMVAYEGNEEQDPYISSEPPTGEKNEYSAEPDQITSRKSSQNREDIEQNSSLSRNFSDPRLPEDVPPVPRIPSALNLPGTFPRDESPVRIEESEQYDPNTPNDAYAGADLLLPDAKNDRTNAANASSLREGRTTERGSSRPTSRRAGPLAISTANDVGDNTKLDIGQLLADIQPQSSPLLRPFDGKLTGESKASPSLTHGVRKPPY